MASSQISDVRWLGKFRTQILKRGKYNCLVMKRLCIHEFKSSELPSASLLDIKGGISCDYIGSVMLSNCGPGDSSMCDTYCDDVTWQCSTPYGNDSFSFVDTYGAYYC